MTDAPLLLMTPGPDARARARAARRRAADDPSSHAGVLARARRRCSSCCAPLFGTREPVLPVHATGRGAMEATICNLFSPGDEIAVCCNGRFGEMWATLAESLRPRRASPRDGLGTRRRSRRGRARRSTAHPGDPRRRAGAQRHVDRRRQRRRRGRAASRARTDVLVLVDGVSSIGGMPFAFDEWGVDVAVTASQKCLMSSPGPVVRRAERARLGGERAARLPRSYWNFADIRREVTKAEAGNARHAAGARRAAGRRSAADDSRRRARRACIAVTPTMAGMVAARRRRARSRAAMSGAPAPLDDGDGDRAAAPSMPPAAGARRPQSSAASSTAAGLEHYQPTAFRIGHMGDIRPADVERTLDGARRRARRRDDAARRASLTGLVVGDRRRRRAARRRCVARHSRTARRRGSSRSGRSSSG